MKKTYYLSRNEAHQYIEQMQVLRASRQFDEGCVLGSPEHKKILQGLGIYGRTTDFEIEIVDDELSNEYNRDSFGNKIWFKQEDNIKHFGE